MSGDRPSKQRFTAHEVIAPLVLSLKNAVKYGGSSCQDAALAWQRLESQADEIERLRMLLQRVVEWDPAFPVESSLLDDIGVALAGSNAHETGAARGELCPDCDGWLHAHGSGCRRASSETDGG